MTAKELVEVLREATAEHGARAPFFQPVRNRLGKAVQCVMCNATFKRRRLAHVHCSPRCASEAIRNSGKTRQPAVFRSVGVWAVQGVQHLSRSHRLSSTPMRERILMNCEPEPNTGCWLWTGACSRDDSTGGYGRIGLKGKLLIAHRAAYEAFKGPIPAGMYLDHLCRVHSCVNPDHLEPVTPQINVLRGQTIVRVNAEKTHCDHGHEFTAENTYSPPNKRERMRRACMRIAGRKHDAKRRGNRRRIVS